MNTNINLERFGIVDAKRHTSSAFGKAEDEELAFLRVYYQDGRESLFAYGYLVEVLLESPEMVSLIFTGSLLIIEGENLAPIMELIQNKQLKFIRAVRKDETPPVSDPGVPVITNIERRGLREARS